MAHFIYLLGAGASAQKIPTVRNLVEEIDSLINFNVSNDNIIHSIISDWVQNDIDRGRSQQVHEYFKLNLLDKFQWISKSIKVFGSPDIYAKYLNVSGKIVELNELKYYLTIIFQLIEYYKGDGYPDQRYIEYIGQICNNKMNTPKNISILSWNYDNQIEIVYNMFTNSLKWNTQSINADLGYRDLNKTLLYKLNGGAYFKNISKEGEGVYYLTDMIPTASSTSRFFEDFKQRLILTENSWKNTGINFSFESMDNVVRKAVERIRRIESEVYLVVIGYSFPYYNREADSLLLTAISEQSLHKIYVQDPNADEVIKRIKGFFYTKREQENIQSICENVQAVQYTNDNPIYQPFHIPMEFSPIYHPDEEQSDQTPYVGLASK